MNKPILSLSNVSKTFQSEADSLCILQNLSFTVDRPATIAVVGESGSGKSTFLNIAGGLEHADSGEICAGAYQLSSLDENGLTEYRLFYLGFIFQFHYLLKDFTALENVMLPALIAGVPKKKIYEKAYSLLHDVKLEHRHNHFPVQLSGGERQRVAVARALINDPKLILADEPTGNLDPDNAHAVQELLFEMVALHHKTLIIVTHDQGIAAHADFCYRLEQGALHLV